MPNKSGIAPVEYKILIQPEEVERKTESGIILTDKVTERDKLAQVRGKLVAVGGNAFEGWEEPIPKVGDTISYAKYAGLIVKGKDEVEYRLANDKDITAIVKEESNDR